MTIKEASEWASNYLDKRVTTSSISFSMEELNGKTKNLLNSKNVVYENF